MDAAVLLLTSALSTGQQPPTSTAPTAPQMAPAAPAVVAGPGCADCGHAPCDPCLEEKKPSLLKRLFGRRHRIECAPACDPCAPAPIVHTPAPCAPACDPCAEERPGLLKRLFGRRKKDDCCIPAPACDGCGSAPLMVPATPVTPAKPAEQVPPAKEMPKDPKAQLSNPLPTIQPTGGERSPF